MSQFLIFDFVDHLGKVITKSKFCITQNNGIRLPQAGKLAVDRGWAINVGKQSYYLSSRVAMATLSIKTSMQLYGYDHLMEPAAGGGVVPDGLDGLDTSCCETPSPVKPSLFMYLITINY